MAYASRDFNKKAPVTDKLDGFDALGVGVNMLGEELSKSTVSLQEKEDLLKEVHHRVKNNLQIIVSMLNLQINYTTDEVLIEKLCTSKNRIMAMAIIHEMLYLSNDLSHINVSHYISRLFQIIQQTYHVDVQLSLELDDAMDAPIDFMIPFGMLLNEVFTNSMKYAYSDKKGKILLRIEKNEQQMKISIQDFGKGMEEAIDFENPSSLGFLLVRTLAEQMDANLNIETKGGVCYELCI